MSHSNLVLDFYIGTTLSLVDPSFTLFAGTWVANAQVRDADHNLVADLAVTLTELDAMTFEHSILLECQAADTATWPVGKLACNILFSDVSDPAVRVPTTSFTINAKRAPTEAG